MAIIIILLVAAIIGAIYQYQKIKERQKDIQWILDSLPEFNATESYIPPMKVGTSIAYDSERMEICFIDPPSDTIIYSSEAILKSEVYVDGQTVLSQSTSSTVGRALLGGVLAGGVGAIIGGVSGKKTQKKKVQSITLKVFVNDTQYPIYRIVFLKAELGSKGVDENTLGYNAAYERAERWHGIISALIRQADELKKEEEKESASFEANHVHSVADELIKLKSLLDAGALTEEEFGEQKRRLLEKGE